MSTYFLYLNKYVSFVPSVLKKHVTSVTYVFKISIFCLICLLCSCGDSEFEYTGHRAYFVFDNSLHLDPTLTASMNSMSPGVFCRIWIADASHISFENNQGLSSRTVINAAEQQRRMDLGVYNQSGIIVGFGTLSQPAVFYAYDAQCPNCYEESNMPRYQLSMDTAGRASCKNCGRSYDMNNGGIVSSGPGGNKLFRYHASTTGPTGILAINN